MRRHALLAPLLALLFAAPAGAAPKIVSAKVEGSALPGDPLTIVVVAVDSKTAVNAVHVSYPDDEGGFGSSACRIQPDGSATDTGAYAPGKQVTFELPYRPSQAGIQQLKVTVTSGACGGHEESATLPLALQVTLPEAPALPIPVPTILPPVARAAATCADSGLVPTSANAARIRAATTCLFNAQRTNVGLALLHTNKRLRNAALRHSRDMVKRHFFDHQGPSGPSFATRLQKARYWPATAAENLGEGSGTLGTPAAMVDAWMHSSLHRANILAPAFRQVGLGVVAKMPQGSAGSTWTADFGRR
jgi:uncharacterized protein YkwD